MGLFREQVLLSLKWAMRDRIYYAVLGVSLFMLLLVPTGALFSMRQVQELSISLSLSVFSLMMVVMALLLGSSVIWREIERRYTASVLTLPITRTTYLLGKFTGVCCALFLCAIVLASVAVLAIIFATSIYPAKNPVDWTSLALAFSFEYLKGVLIAALAITFSTVATSFYLPFFASIGVFLAGGMTQQVVEYMKGEHGGSFSPLMHVIVDFFYYLLPNFSAFDLKVYAIYSLPFELKGVLLSVGYFVVYCTILLTVALFCFGRRQLP